MKRLLVGVTVITCAILGVISCSKETSLEKRITTEIPAVFSLKDTSGSCLAASVFGTYYNGVPTSDTTYILQLVRVTTPGAYTFTTNTQNGFAFSSSGTFLSAGLDTVRLKAAGIPVLPNSTNFSLGGGATAGSPCPLLVMVQDSTGRGRPGGTNTSGNTTNKSDSAWEFTAGTSFYHGSIDTAYLFDTTYASLPFTILTVNGRTGATEDSIFSVSIALPGTTSLQPGVYSSTIAAQFSLSDVSLNFIYEADPTTTGVTTQVTISSYDATTKMVKGSFSGTAKTSSGAVTITNGYFTAKVG